MELHVFRIATETTLSPSSSSLVHQHARHYASDQSSVFIHAHHQSRVSPSLVSQNSAPPSSSRYSPPARLATVILAVKKERRHHRETEAQKNLALDQTGIPECHNYIQLKSFSSCMCKKRTSGMSSRDLARYNRHGKAYLGELRVWHLYIAIFLQTKEGWRAADQAIRGKRPHEFYLPSKSFPRCVFATRSFVCINDFLGKFC